MYFNFLKKNINVYTMTVVVVFKVQAMCRKGEH